METTKKPFLSSSRSGSAASERESHDKSEPVLKQSGEEPRHEGHQIVASKFWRTRLSKHSDGQSSTGRPSSNNSSEPKIAPHTMRSVMTSLNKMAMLRQRAIANRGNATTSSPFRKFVPREVEIEMERIISTAIKGVIYDSKRASVLARSLSDTIRNKLKIMKFPRYKFVCFVAIVDKSQPELIIGSRCLWDAAVDSYVTVEVNNSSMAAIATVYAIHHE